MSEKVEGGGGLDVLISSLDLKNLVIMEHFSGVDRALCMRKFLKNNDFVTMARRKGSSNIAVHTVTLED